MATYLVTQASGTQSSATITHLLRNGAKVHALVRNPEKEVKVLQSPGVTVFKGESTDFEAVLAAAKGCQGVFINTFPIPGVEAEQARTITAAARQAGVETVVVTTAMLAGDRSAWDNEATKALGVHGYYTGKAAVETIVKEAGFSAYTILRPAAISIDYLLPWAAHNYPDLAQTGTLVHSFDEGAKWLHVNPDFIGQFGALALQHPEKLNGQEIELGTDLLTMEEARDVLERVSGKKIGIRKRTADEPKGAAAMVAAFQEWANSTDLSKVQDASIKAAEKYGVKCTTLEDFLLGEKDALLASLPA